MAQQTNVAFLAADPGVGWLGGVNYIRNLLSAVRDEPVGIVPVAFVSARQDASVPLEGIKRVPTRLFDTRVARRARRTIIKVTGRDLLLERLLRKNGIEVLSHSGLIGRRSSVPTLNWIPDLQHRRLPDFFSRLEVENRDRSFEQMCTRSTLIIASSECARKDLEEFFPSAVGKVRVLRFVALSAHAARATAPTTLSTRYGSAGRYFLVPNQFWVHKNHAVIFRALAVLKRRGRPVRVLATGHASDYRHPEFFAKLMEQRAELGIEEQFSCLGVVPYDDLVGLARGAVALINPSLFEGWSTSVEEAKALGKKILLSDIAVHREQAPARGEFFGSDDAEALANLMWAAWQAFDPEEETKAAARAARETIERRRQFADTYSRIVREAVGR